MAPFKPESIPVFSLLDRLSEPDTDNDSEVFLSQEATAAPQHPDRHGGKFHTRKFVELFEKSIKRDLEWLFNTRQTFDDRLAGLPQLSSSVFAFGLPDTTVNATSVKGLECLAAAMQKVTETFDPRLREVRIEIGTMSGIGRVVEFRIRGVLMINPAPEEVVIDAVFDSSLSKYKVV
jgi:type VI secretion system protein ImpF